MADVSIIIPSFNEEGGIVTFLTKLQSLRTRCELILVDGGSEDDTVILAEPYVDKLIKSAKGRAVQMNTGAASASAPVLLFLHSDTYLPINAVDYIQQAINSGYCWGRFDITLSGKPKILGLIAWLMNKRSRWTGIATGDQAIFVKQTTFKQLGGFPKIALMEDIALCSSLKQQGKPYCIRSVVTSSGRRWIRFGIVKTILLMWWLRLRYFFGAKPNDLEYLYRKGLFWKE